MGNRIVLVGLLVAAGVACGSFGTSGTEPGGVSPDADSGTDGSVPDVAGGASKPRIYLVGGESPSAFGNVLLKDVLFAEVQADGSLTSWQAATSLPAAHSHFAAVATPSRMIVLGGLTNAPINRFDLTRAAPFTAAGAGDWNDTGALGKPLASHAAVATTTNAYVIGGDSFGGTDEGAIYRANVRPDGSLSAFSPLTVSLPKARKRLAATIGEGYLYIVGGSGAETCDPELQRVPIQPNGDLGTFEKVGVMPRREAAAIVHRKMLYVLGGYDCGTQLITASVQYTNLVDGKPQEFVEATKLRKTLRAMSVVLVGDWLYVIGGDGDGMTDEVSFTKIDTDGSLGTWQTTSALPRPTAYAAAVVH